MEKCVAKLQSSELRRYAVLGAEQRLISLAEEAERIYKSFPELRDRSGRSILRRTSPTSVDGEASPQTARKGRRRRRTMSADARRRISEAQKARWAKQKGDAKPTGSAPKKK